MNHRLEVEIAEMILEGVPALERHRFADAFQAELERLLLEGDGTGLASSGERPPAIHAARTVYEEVVRCMREAIAGRTVNG